MIKIKAQFLIVMLMSIVPLLAGQTMFAAQHENDFSLNESKIGNQQQIKAGRQAGRSDGQLGLAKADNQGYPSEYQVAYNEAYDKAKKIFDRDQAESGRISGEQDGLIGLPKADNQNYPKPIKMLIIKPTIKSKQLMTKHNKKLEDNLG